MFIGSKAKASLTVMRTRSGRRIRWGRLAAVAGTVVAIAVGVYVFLNGEEARVKFRQIGVASWYGPGFHGKKTASGERYDQNAMTAAHRKLPLGTEVTVTNLENGRSVHVEITDRGPYVKGRHIDLSKAAARELGLINDGTAKVRIEATADQLRSDDAKTDD
jgi:peptidoglycan lytic transglycosylase